MSYIASFNFGLILSSLLLPLAGSLVIPANLNIQDKGSLLESLNQASAMLIRYYNPNEKGAVPENSSKDAKGIQWYESGILWGALMDYTTITQDKRFLNTISGALGNASYHETASFLDGSSSSSLIAKLTGKWNDDILWWSFGAMSAAELLGKEATTPSGTTFLQIATNTFNEVYEKWDPKTCHGGIFWSRDNQPSAGKRGQYKSSITNAQFVMLGARLAKFTREESYLVKADQVYRWMQRSGLIQSNGSVFDGAYAPSCSEFNKNELSYISGTLVGALGWMFQATGNNQYIQDAKKILQTSKLLYEKNGVMIDRCEPNCEQNNSQPKGTALRGYMYLWNSTTDAEIRSHLQSLVLNSVKAMLPTCTEDWGCNSVWLPRARKYFDFHTQIVTVELLNAALLMSGHKAEPLNSKANNCTSLVNVFSTILTFLMLLYNFV